MALGDMLLAGQIACHCLLVILSFCIFVPLSINGVKFRDHCLLFTSGEWREKDGMLDVDWASLGFCNFPLIYGFILITISIIQIMRYVAKRNEEPTFLALFIDVVLGIWTMAMSILSAIMITLGFIVWCDTMTERFPSCEVSAGQDIIYNDTDKIDTSGFYIEMGTAQFGAWGSFAISVGVCVIALLKLVNNHQVRNIKVSMYLERQRLVNDYQAQFDGRSTPPLVPNAASDTEQNK